MIPHLHELGFTPFTRWWEEAIIGRVRVCHSISEGGSAGSLAITVPKGAYTVELFSDESQVDLVQEWNELDALSAQAVIHHLNETYFRGNR